MERNVSFVFVYNIHQSDTSLLDTRAQMGVLHQAGTQLARLLLN